MRCFSIARATLKGRTTTGMAKTKQQKTDIVDDIADKFSRMKSAVVVDFRGLKVKDAQKIREKTWLEQVDYDVVKKSLLKLALEKAGLGESIDPKKLNGNIGVVTGYDDEIQAAKFAADASRECEAFKILGGFLEKQYVGVDKIIMLAALPSKVELLAKMVRSIQAPVSGFVNVLAGNLRGLVRVLGAIRESKLS